MVLGSCCPVCLRTANVASQLAAITPTAAIRPHFAFRGSRSRMSFGGRSERPTVTSRNSGPHTSGSAAPWKQVQLFDLFFEIDFFLVNLVTCVRKRRAYLCRRHRTEGFAVFARADMPENGIADNRIVIMKILGLPDPEPAAAQRAAGLFFPGERRSQRCAALIRGEPAFECKTVDHIFSIFFLSGFIFAVRLRHGVTDRFPAPKGRRGGNCQAQCAAGRIPPCGTGSLLRLRPLPARSKAVPAPRGTEAHGDSGALA